jgi:hypothetical protein
VRGLIPVERRRVLDARGLGNCTKKTFKLGKLIFASG